MYVYKIRYKTFTFCSQRIKEYIVWIFIIASVLILQIKSESFLEDVNNILNSGDVPNLYAVDEQERILTAMQPVVKNLGQQPTKSNLMAAYIKRVRQNIHTVLCMRLAEGQKGL